MKIKEPFEQDKVFFISDTHFGHYNIIDYSDRPFNDNEEMTNAIIDRWNEVVPIDADVFHLGDFALCTTKYIQMILARLNGRIHLTVGNHEKTVLKPKHIREKFYNIADITEIKVNDRDLPKKYAYIVMCHYPMLRWNKSHHGSWHLYGHVHGGLSNKGFNKHPSPNAYDVGVDINNFTPLTYQQIKTIITKQNMK